MRQINWGFLGEAMSCVMLIYLSGRKFYFSALKFLA